MIEPLVRKLELRDPLLEEERAALEAAALPPTRMAKGEELVAQGSEPTSSTLLLEGLTARATTVASGQRQITALHISGDFVDLHSFLMKGMDHSIIALSEGLITKVPHAQIRLLTERFPHLARMLWLNTLLDAAIHRRWLAAMGRQRSVSHFAHLICEQYTRLKVVGLAADGVFEFPLSQVELADVLGLSQVHVNRSLQQLRAEGLVAWRGPRVEILDWDGLVETAEFDPLYLQLEPRRV
jgi:CRP-like cAMP-binding protein